MIVPAYIPETFNQRQERLRLKELVKQMAKAKQSYEKNRKKRKSKNKKK